jgi:hypothetical protein
MDMDRRRLTVAIAVGSVLLLALAYATTGVAGTVVAAVLIVGLAGFLLGRIGAIVAVAALLTLGLAYALGRNVDDTKTEHALQVAQAEVQARDRALNVARDQTRTLAVQVTTLRDRVKALETRVRRAERSAKRARSSRRTRRRR